MKKAIGLALALAVVFGVTVSWKPHSRLRIGMQEALANNSCVTGMVIEILGRSCPETTSVYTIVGSFCTPTSTNDAFGDTWISAPGCAVGDCYPTGCGTNSWNFTLSFDCSGSCCSTGQTIAGTLLVYYANQRYPTPYSATLPAGCCSVSWTWCWSPSSPCDVITTCSPAAMPCSGGGQNPVLPIVPADREVYTFVTPPKY